MQFQITPPGLSLLFRLLIHENNYTLHAYSIKHNYQMGGCRINQVRTGEGGVRNEQQMTEFREPEGSANLFHQPFLNQNIFAFVELFCFAPDLFEQRRVHPYILFLLQAELDIRCFTHLADFEDIMFVEKIARLGYGHFFQLTFFHFVSVRGGKW